MYDLSIKTSMPTTSKFATATNKSVFYAKKFLSYYFSSLEDIWTTSNSKYITPKHYRSALKFTLPFYPTYVKTLAIARRR